MKKSAFLIIFVCLTLLVSAVSAETGLLTLKARDLTTGRGTRNLAYESEDTRTYSLMDPQGNLLTSEAYTYMSNYIDTSLWRVKVASSDGVHVEGVIDDQGRVIVPPQYADITIWSDRWCTGVKLVPSSSDDSLSTASIRWIFTTTAGWRAPCPAASTAAWSHRTAIISA